MSSTRQEIDAYVAAHPAKKAELFNPLTVVRRRGNDLVGVPYHEAYKQWLEPAAKALREAAILSAPASAARAALAASSRSESSRLRSL